jgi:Concanavalin A-like lectin/glucanases superfamily
MSRSFSTTGDHLDASYALGSLPFTLSAWFKLTTLGATQRGVAIGTGGSGTNYYGLSATATNACSATHNDGTNSIATAGATTLGDSGWHNCVASFASASSRSAFLDGINKGTAAGARTVLTPNAIRVGLDLAGAAQFHGLISHVAIWGGTLADSDVATLATLSPNMVRPDILLDYWPLQSNNVNEPSFGASGTVLAVTGTTFSTDDPPLNQGIIQPMYYQRKVIYSI